jgi:hypothetical protein
MNFIEIVSNIEYTSDIFKQSAITAVNYCLTFRNWLIGLYIVEFEQNGEDRAKYGSKLLKILAEKLSNHSLSYSNLKLYRQFYLRYPQISEVLPVFLKKFSELNGESSIGFFEKLKTKEVLKGQSPIGFSEKEAKKVNIQLLQKISFTHFVQLLPIDNEEKRFFYEQECIKGTWSVRELRRQIDSLYYERSVMSKKPQLLRSEKIENNNMLSISEEFIKSPFSFEFLGL